MIVNNKMSVNFERSAKNIESHSIKVIIHEQLHWLDYPCTSDDAYDFLSYRQPIADFTALIKNKICKFDTELLSSYSKKLNFDKHYLLDYRSYIPYIIDYEQYYFPDEWKFLTVHIGEDEEELSKRQMMLLLLQKLTTLSYSDLALAKEITEFYYETVKSASYILGIIFPYPNNKNYIFEIEQSLNAFKDLLKCFKKKEATLKHVNIEFEQIYIESKSDRANAAAKSRQLYIVGLLEPLKLAFSDADNPSIAIAEFILSFQGINTTTLATQINGTISDYRSSNSNASNVSQNTKEKDLEYLGSKGFKQSLIEKFRKENNR